MSIIRRAVLLTAVSVVLVPTTAWAGPAGWTDEFGTSGFDAIYQIDADASEQLYGTGEFAGKLSGQHWQGSCDAVVRSYRASGQVRWTREFGTPACDSAEGVAVGGSAVYVGGYFNDALSAFVRRYDTQGNEAWTREFATPDPDGIPFGIVEGLAADSQSLYAGGQVFGSLPDAAGPSSFNGFVRKYDPSGNVVWTREIFTSNGGSVLVTEVDLALGGVVAVGRAGGPVSGQPHVGGRDAFVRLYDANGNEVWTREFGTVGPDIAWGVASYAGAIYVAADAAGALPGQTFAGGPLDAVLRTYDSIGNVVWTREFGTAGFDRAIRVDADATRVAVVGRAGGVLGCDVYAGGATDPFVRVYDPAGTALSTVQFGGTDEPEAATGVVLGSDRDDIFISGGVGGRLKGQQYLGGTDAFVSKVVTDDHCES